MTASDLPMFFGECGDVWQSPIVVNGRVYIGASDGLHIFGFDRVFADGFDAAGAKGLRPVSR